MYLVTGGAGFIGSHIACFLAERGERVRVIDNLSSGRLDNLRGCLSQIEFVKADICDSSPGRLFQGVRCVLHQAAIASVDRSIRDPLETEKNNVGGTVSVLKQAKEAGVQRVVLASTAAVYGNSNSSPLKEDAPVNLLSPYGISKHACEIYARYFAEMFGLETVVLRYFNVFGPNQDPASDYSGVITKFVDCMSNRTPPVIFGDGRQTRDFIFVRNVAEANYLASLSPRVGRGEVINIAGGENISINGLVEALNEVLSTTLKPRYAEAKPGEVRHSQADISRARQLLDYEVKIGFHDGLRLLVEWWNSEQLSRIGQSDRNVSDLKK